MSPPTRPRNAPRPTRAAAPGARAVLPGGGLDHATQHDILALQRLAGNQNIARVAANSTRPAKPFQYRRSNITLKRTAGTWAIGGRPAFRSDAKAIEIDGDEHRAHTISWEDIRTAVQRYLNEGDAGDLTSSVHALFPYTLDDTPDPDQLVRRLETARTTLTSSDPPDKDALETITDVLGVMNSSVGNLDPGHGTTNSAIGGAFDPKLERTPSGRWDVDEAGENVAFFAAGLHGSKLKRTASNEHVLASATDTDAVGGRKKIRIDQLGPRMSGLIRDGNM